jgi:hypothetical protein
MTNFQALLDLIKEFKEGSDYTFKSQELLGNQKYQKENIYFIHSEQLKKEERKIAFWDDIEVGELCQVGTEINEK